MPNLEKNKDLNQNVKKYLSQNNCETQILNETIENSLFNSAESRKKKLFGEQYYASQIAQCDRRIVYRAIGKESEIEFDEFQTITNNVIKNKWIKLFSLNYDVKIIQNVKVADSESNMCETIDCIVEVDKVPYVVLINGLKNEEYCDIINNAPPRRDIINITLQMWLSEIKNGILLYENRNTLEYTVIHVLPNKAIVEGAVNKCKKMSELKIFGKLPERKYKEIGVECNMCEFKKMCRTGEK